jgi:twitching motility protein PilT
MKLDELLITMIAEKASDLHLRMSRPPVIRVDGILRPIDGMPDITRRDLEEAFKQMTNDNQRQEFLQQMELDFAYSVAGLSRFRVNAFQQRGTLSLAIRQIPFEVPSLDDLQLPEICKTLVHRPRGLILVTGRTGTGKSTTLAAMIDHLNKTQSRNVITIEDPIEYLFKDDKCWMAQRELGYDTPSFASALRHVLRQDPDVILVGEMRDLETIATAITAAETGHLVLSTLHTPSAPQAIDRIVDAFPPHQQEQIRLQLSLVLEAVLSQTLLRRASGSGRIAAVEIMIGTDAIRNLIREGKTEQIASYMQTGSTYGMQTMDQAFKDLIHRRIVAPEEVLAFNGKPQEILNSYSRKC